MTTSSFHPVLQTLETKLERVKNVIQLSKHSNCKFPNAALCIGLHRCTFLWNVLHTIHYGFIRFKFLRSTFFSISTLLPLVQTDICDASKSCIAGLVDQKYAMGHVEFVTTPIIVKLMPLELKMKLARLMKSVKPREKLTYLGTRDALHAKLKVLAQTSGTVYREKRRALARKMPCSGVRYIRFNHLPGYCNYLDMTDTQRFRFKWKRGPLKWPKDVKYLQNLDPREIALAAKLGISGRMYCDCKHRIFAQRVFRRCYGFPLRLIDAQRVCRTHYQTTARLYEAFKSLGWLRLRYARNHVRASRYDTKKGEKPYLRTYARIGGQYLAFCAMSETPNLNMCITS